MDDALTFEPSDQQLGPARLRRSSYWARNLTVSATILFAIVLSIVSFWTTWVGMNEFLAPKVPVVEAAPDASQAAPAANRNGGQPFIAYRAEPDLQSRFLSAGTTFGIQGLMFVISIMLGRHLIRMRPMERPALSPEADFGPRAAPRQTNRGSGADNPASLAANRAWLAAGLFLAILAFWRWMGMPGLGGIFEPAQWRSWLTSRQEAGGADLRTIAYAALAVACLMQAGTIRVGWAGLITAFLLFVYLGTMAVSSIFSFDAYYRFLRSAGDLKLESRSIVGEETADIVIRAGRLLDREILAREQAMRALPEFTGMKAELARLDSRIEAHDEELRREGDIFLKRQTELEEISRNQAADKAERIALADAEIARLESTRNSLEARNALGLAEIERLEADIAALQAEIDPYLAIREEARKRMDLEETGADGRAGGRGKKWDSARRDYEAADDFIRLREGRIEVRRQEIAGNRESLAALSAEMAAIPGLIARQETLKGITPDPASGPETIAPADGTPQGEPAGEVAVAAALQPPVPATELAARADRAWNLFEQEPTKSNFGQYTNACNDLTGKLLKAAPDDPVISDFRCSPPELGAEASQLFAMLEARYRFDRTCGDNGMQSLRNGTPEQAFSLARNCLSTSAMTGPDIASLANRLTQLVSVHSVEGHDFRRSIENLRRGEPYALGAAFGAVFVDSLILVVGMIAAMLFQSPLTANHRNLTAEEMQQAILEVLDLYSPGNRPAAARHLLRLCEADPSADYPLKITMSRLGKQDRVLFNGLVAMGRTFIEPRRQGAIYGIHINLARLLYDVAAQARPAGPQAKPAAAAASTASQAPAPTVLEAAAQEARGKSAKAAKKTARAKSGKAFAAKEKAADGKRTRSNAGAQKSAGKQDKPAIPPSAIAGEQLKVVTVSGVAPGAETVPFPIDRMKTARSGAANPRSTKPQATPRRRA